MNEIVFDSGPPSVSVRGSGCATTAGRSGGRRKKNQDAVIVLPSMSDCLVDLYCVLDGHGPYGETVASWLAGNLPFAIQTALRSFDKGTAASIGQAFLQLDADCSFFLGAKTVEMSGATATVALHKNGKLLVAGLGDSRAILGRADKTGRDRIQVLTAAHNPADPAERSVCVCLCVCVCVSHVSV